MILCFGRMETGKPRVEVLLIETAPPDRLKTMISSNSLNRLVEIFPAEMRLVRQARAGDINAFVNLCGQHLERVYLFIHFLVPNNRVAEGLTLQIFFKAWEQFDDYRMFDESFPLWLYSIARYQVSEYHRTHKLRAAPDNVITLAARGAEFREDFQTLRDSIRWLAVEQQHILILKFVLNLPEKEIAHVMKMSRGEVRALNMQALCDLTAFLKNTDFGTITQRFRSALEDSLSEILRNASTLEESLIRRPDLSLQLKPVLETALLLHLGRDAKPLPAFAAYTHDALMQYLRIRPRRAAVISVPALRRMPMAFAVLVAALLVTGTVHAQSALPGERFYGWKRASEVVLHTLSPDSVAMDIMLVERRLNEWIAVMNDPALSPGAQEEYQKALAQLDENKGADESARVAAVLRSQQTELTEAGLFSPALDEYLSEVSEVHPADANPQGPPAWIFATPTATSVSPAAISTEDTVNDCPPKCGNGVGPGSNNAGGNGVGRGSNNAGSNDKPDKNKPDNNKPDKDNNAGGNKNDKGK